ncbi:tRNA (adenosine(37)-N6)-threonylcarbamoyltransferase complex ATPase subunit type 1 TsaE [Spiroplasma apis]|uniref:tRNA threonylcarbamoyladenosine biosynthesis protein TsaE n=1 Tax=Spiroplasma apis B31 TaxID=1276258 RepID=V5RJQ2_SPIAP|nr:tRNA (adenosine(37)-N6)-threonylcarbamoyltransferase complex ATPase subunit type 1 TsaE [Spiroplasma apis]AHB35995.1 hypothetical protein SAPIS_v1c01490 [Spiroplasma apis B31]
MKVSSLSELQKVFDALDLREPKNTCILLNGPMGAGKTTFTKLLLKEMGVTDVVTSPTYVIMNQFIGRNNLHINHVDAYRMSKGEEIDMYTDYFYDSLNVIEWSENMNYDFKKNFKIIIINISIIDETTREFIIE